MKWHIRAIFFCSAIFLCLFTAFFIFQVSKVRPKDHKRWAKLVRESKFSENKQQKTLLSEQHRNNVSKEIYIQSDPKRYLRIDSATSILTLCTKNGQVAVTEIFEEVEACIQEISSPTQSIYLIKAKKAFFDYSNKKLTVENPTIFSYILEGSVLPPFPLQAPPSMIAKADHITVEFDTPLQVMHCTHMFTFLCDKESYIFSPYMSYFPKEDKALFIGNETEAVCIYDLIRKTALSTKSIEAFSLCKPGKEKITMHEDVRITSEIDIVDKLKNAYPIIIEKKQMRQKS